MLAIWTLDEAIADSFAQARDPMLAAIRARWWENAIAAGRGGDAPAIGAALATERRAGDRVLMAQLAQAWGALDATPTGVEHYAGLRGDALATLTADRLDWSSPTPSLQGWALVDLVRRDRNRALAAAAIKVADPIHATAKNPRFLRILQRLAATDLAAGVLNRARRRRDLFHALF